MSDLFCAANEYEHGKRGQTGFSIVINTKCRIN